MNKKTDTCITGNCPIPIERHMHTVKLSEGSGGKEMQSLIQAMQEHFAPSSVWKHESDDGATFPMGTDHLVFTTDAYVVQPIFFPGGNIGKIAFCGTVNDLAVMGARPIGISLSLILEEGFSKDELMRIIKTIGDMSNMTGIPIVTGDTKVVERGGIDKIIINTSGVGIAERVLSDSLVVGDIIIVSGGIGEHGAALLARRFELETTLETDSKPLHEELLAIGDMVKQAKDITRGGLAAILNELAEKNAVGMEIEEQKVPMHQQVRSLTEILGIDVYSLACEGRFVCVVDPQYATEVLHILQTFHPMAQAIGTVQSGKGVMVQTAYGKKILSMPSGNIVPRIC
ncbi:MAG: hydrogenase expression/formation protein HypE [Candidatus Moraniibacteriota bacterium]